MNRAVTKLLSTSTRLLPRLYASTTTTTTTTTATATGHHNSGEAHHHDDHDHHHHHHEPELRHTQTWRHHSGINSKYENQGEDPNLMFTQERANYYDYLPGLGQNSSQCTISNASTSI